jgi:hypothetical protein
MDPLCWCDYFLLIVIAQQDASHFPKGKTMTVYWSYHKKKNSMV